MVKYGAFLASPYEVKDSYCITTGIGDAGVGFGAGVVDT
jgi:hypothetical protein